MRSAIGGTQKRAGPAGALRLAAARALAGADEIVDYRALVPLRIVAGGLTLVHLAPFLADAGSGVTYGDGFTVPYGGWYPELPVPLYVAALFLAAAGAVMISLGLFTRVATGFTAAFVVHNLFLSRTHYHHNRAFLAVLLVGLALVPAGDAVSLDARRRRRAGGRPPLRGVRWPLMLLRFQVAAVYAASGISKLLDPDWFGGTVTRLRVERRAATAVASGIPQAIVDLVAAPGFQAVFAKVVVLTEIFIGLGLLVPRLRTAAIWVAIPFHLAIAATADVEVFSWAALAALAIWVTPRSRDRLVVIGRGGAAGRRMAALVRVLDWTGRFRVKVRPGGRDVLRLHDRDGTVSGGLHGLLGVTALLPATFLLAAPLRFIARRGVHSWQGTASGRTG